MTPDQLRDAGYSLEADRLARSLRDRDVWARTPADAVSSRAVALSLFGSARFDELADALGLPLFGGDQ